MPNFANDMETLPEGLSGPIPAGEYLVQLVDLKRKDTKAGDGWYYNAQYTVIGPTYKNARFFQMYNYQHTNPKAVEIGRGKMRDMLRASGIADLGKYPELAKTHADMRKCPPEDPDSVSWVLQHAKAFLVKLDIESDSYGDKNLIKYCQFNDGREPAGAKPAATVGDKPPPF